MGGLAEGLGTLLRRVSCGPDGGRPLQTAHDSGATSPSSRLGIVLHAVTMAPSVLTALPGECRTVITRPALHVRTRGRRTDLVRT